MQDMAKTLLILFVALAATPLGAQSTAPAVDEPKYTLDFETSSHVVRQEEDRFNFRYNTDGWDIEGLFASVAPRFREDRDQFGVLLERGFDWGELIAVGRITDKDEGQDIVGSLHYQRTRGENAFGAEVTFGQADLLTDEFLAGDGVDQFVGKVFWRRADFDVEVFGSSSGTFDLMRGSGELLERLPRSEIVGAETLSDLYIDEARLEDSFGAAVGFERDKWRARVYAKSGEQILRGFLDPDDVTGIGGEYHRETDRFRLDVELDLRLIDTEFDAFDRGRAFVDLSHRVTKRLEWGFGAYVQGEGETFSEIPDIYDTAGGGLSLTWSLQSGNKIGFWAMAEDNAPDFQEITRLAVFYRKSDREYGIGIRQDTVGQARFEEDNTGPFFMIKRPFGNLLLDALLGVLDGESYGTISIGFRR